MDKTITYVIAILAVVSLVIAAYGFVTFQGQIDNLQTSINEMDGQLTSIGDIEGQLNSIQAQIGEYQSIIEEQEQEISEYKTVTLADYLGNVVTLTSPPFD